MPSSWRPATTPAVSSVGVGALTDEDLRASSLVPYPDRAGRRRLLRLYVPHRSGPNLSHEPRRVLYVTTTGSPTATTGPGYYADKRKNYPPDRRAGAGPAVRLPGLIP